MVIKMGAMGHCMTRAPGELPPVDKTREDKKYVTQDDIERQMRDIRNSTRDGYLFQLDLSNGHKLTEIAANW